MDTCTGGVGESDAQAVRLGRMGNGVIRALGALVVFQGPGKVVGCGLGVVGRDAPVLVVAGQA